MTNPTRPQEASSGKTPEKTELSDEQLNDVAGGGTVLGPTITAPRDAASGLPTGKRQHKPVVLP